MALRGPPMLPAYGLPGHVAITRHIICMQLDTSAHRDTRKEAMHTCVLVADRLFWSFLASHIHYRETDRTASAILPTTGYFVPGASCPSLYARVWCYCAQPGKASSALSKHVTCSAADECAADQCTGRPGGPGSLHAVHVGSSAMPSQQNGTKADQGAGYLKLTHRVPLFQAQNAPPGGGYCHWLHSEKKP